MRCKPNHWFAEISSNCVPGLRVLVEAPRVAGLSEVPTQHACEQMEWKYHSSFTRGLSGNTGFWMRGSVRKLTVHTDTVMMCVLPRPLRSLRHSLRYRAWS